MAYAAKQAARQADCRGRGVSTDWPLCEVFVRARRGLSPQPRRQPARRRRRDGAAERPRSSTPAARRASRIWVVPSASITASSPDEKDAFFEPGRGQGLPPPDLLRRAVRGADVSTLGAGARHLHPVHLRAPAGRRRLVLSHRLAEWAGRAPQIEEDIALTNIGLDLLGQARSLLTHAGELEGAGRGRGRPRLPARGAGVPLCLLVEQPNDDDFAVTMARQLLFSAYQLPLLRGADGLGRTRCWPASPPRV